MEIQIEHRRGGGPLKRAAKAALAIFIALGAMGLIFFVVLPAVFVAIGIVLLILAVAVPIAIVVRAVWPRGEGAKRVD